MFFYAEYRVNSLLILISNFNYITILLSVNMVKYVLTVHRNGV